MVKVMVSGDGGALSMWWLVAMMVVFVMVVRVMVSGAVMFIIMVMAVAML